VVRRLFWSVFLLAALGCLVLFTWELLPDVRNTRAAWRQQVASAVPGKAFVVSKREEYVPNPGSESFYAFFVTLEHQKDGNAFRRELAFRAGPLPRRAWEQVAVGDVVEIRVDPRRPEVFYAPSFLSVSEAFTPEAVNYFMYVSLTIAALGGMGTLLYLKVLRRDTDSASRRS
jgi:hypothetical protein